MKRFFYLPLSFSSLFILSSVLFVHAEPLSGAEKKYVSVKPATRLLIYPEYNAPAKVIAKNVSLLPAEISAVVSAYQAVVGQQVKKSDVLATFDCEKPLIAQKAEKARYQMLKQQLAFDQRELLRAESLKKQKSLGEAALDAKKNTVLRSQYTFEAQAAALALADHTVSRCDIKAPFNGVVTQRFANVGEMIDLGKPVFELLEQSTLEVSAQIPLIHQTSFLQANDLFFSVQDKRYSLIKQYFLPLIQENARSQEARLLFNDEMPLMGLTGRLVWQSEQAYLPAYLLLARNNRYGYFVAENNRAKFVEVEQAEEGRPIKFTLSENSSVVVEGYYGLNDGDVIDVVNTQQGGL